MPRKQTDRRVTATLDAAMFDKLRYLAENRGESMSDCLRDAIQLLIRYANEDYYPLAKLEAERINQFQATMAQVLEHLIRLEQMAAVIMETMVGSGNYLSGEGRGGA